MGIVMHSYTFRDYSLEHALEKAAEYGYDGVELILKFVDESNPQALVERLRSLQDETGVKLTVVSAGANVLLDEESERRANIERLKRTLEWAHRVGIVILNTGPGSLVAERKPKEPPHEHWGRSGSNLAKEVHYERAAQAFKELGQVASDLGMVITFEIHMVSLTDTAVSTVKLLEMIDRPNVMSNFDAGNMYATPHAEPVLEAIDILRGRIGYVHMKNCKNIASTYDYSVLLDSGDLDYYGILQRLFAQGYSGHFGIEYVGRGDPHVAARRNIQYARSLLEELRPL